MRARAGLAAAVAVALTAAWPVHASSDGGAAARGAAWIAARQQPGGEFFRAGQPADGVADAITALVAGGGRQAVVERAIPYLRTHAWERASKRAAYAGRVVMALVAAGQNPRAFAGHDFVARIKAFYDPVTGFYDTGSAQFSNSLAALGLLAAGESLPPEAMRAIRLSRCPDGGFSFDPGCANREGSDVDTTSMVLCVLVAAGVPPTDGVRADARAFLLAAVNGGGGYGFYADEPTNANSTGLALAAIAALKENPTAAPWKTPGGNPRAALLALQTSSGGFRRDATFADADAFATVQAVPGAAGLALPVAARAAVLGEKRSSSPPFVAPSRGTAGRTAGATASTRATTVTPGTAPRDASIAARAQTALANARAVGASSSRSVSVALAFALFVASAGAFVRRARSKA